jgi:hypothetical protein
VRRPGLVAAELVQDSGRSAALDVAPTGDPLGDEAVTPSVVRLRRAGPGPASPLSGPTGRPEAPNAREEAKGSWALPNPLGKKLLRPLHLEEAGRTLERLREWGSEATTYKALGLAAMSDRARAATGR